MGRIFGPKGGGGADTSIVTATANDVLEEKVIVDAEGNPLTGTIPVKGRGMGTMDENITLGVSSNGVDMYAQGFSNGYYNGDGGANLVYFPKSLTGNAAASQVLSGVKATSQNGLNFSGTMVNRGNINYTLPINGSYTIPSGFHGGSGKVKQTITTQGATTYTPRTYNQTIAGGRYLTGTQTIVGDADLVAGNIKKGVNIFGVTGTWEGYVATATDFYKYGLNVMNFTGGTYIVFESNRIYITNSTSTEPNVAIKTSRTFNFYPYTYVNFEMELSQVSTTVSQVRFGTYSSIGSLGDVKLSSPIVGTKTYKVIIPTAMKKNTDFSFAFANMKGYVKRIWVS